MKDHVTYLTVDVDGMRVVVAIHGNPSQDDLIERLNRKFAGSYWSPVYASVCKPDFAAIARGYFRGWAVEHRSIAEKRPYG